MRRVLLAMLLALLAACGGDPEDQSDRFVRVDAPRPSPSGEYTASLVEEKDSTTLVLKDKSGAEVFRDGLGYGSSRTSETGGITWLSDRDQLWILSTEGHTYVERDPERGWVRRQADGLPDELKRVG